VWGLVGPGLSLAGMLLGVACHGGSLGVLAGAGAGLVVGGLPGLATAAARVLHDLPGRSRP
jgi:hypothetical protein